MVEQFGFSREEAERHTTAARSYMAVPIRSAGDVVGVMYFFSTEPQIFPHVASETMLDQNAAFIVGLLRPARWRSL